MPIQLLSDQQAAEVSGGCAIICSVIDNNLQQGCRTQTVRCGTAAPDLKLLLGLGEQAKSAALAAAAAALDLRYDLTALKG